MKAGLVVRVKNMDIKKPPYQIAYEARMAQLGESMKSEHRGIEPSRDPQLEIRPTAGNVQLGEGNRK